LKRVHIIVFYWVSNMKLRKQKHHLLKHQKQKIYLYVKNLRALLYLLPNLLIVDSVSYQINHILVYPWLSNEFQENEQLHHPLKTKFLNQVFHEMKKLEFLVYPHIHKILTSYRLIKLLYFLAKYSSPLPLNGPIPEHHYATNAPFNGIINY